MTHASENIEEYIDVQKERMIGSALPEPLLMCQITLDKDEGKHQRRIIKIGQDLFIDVIVCFLRNQCSFEIGKWVRNEKRENHYRDLPKEFAKDEDHEFCRRNFLGWISDMTGHDRTVYYQFVEDGDGVVVDEVRREASMQSYLGLRVPASDIPKIARDLYVKNRWRMIPDISAEAVSILGIRDNGDLSCVDLRSVSLVHKIYMQNMGIQSSISFPIIKSGKLHALISCHSREPKYIEYQRLDCISKSIEHYNRILNEFQITKKLKHVENFSGKDRHLRFLLGLGESLHLIWEQIAVEISNLFEVDGVALCVSDVAYTFGAMLHEDSLKTIDNWFLRDKSKLVFHTDRFQKTFENIPPGSIAGICGLKFISHSFGNEVVRLYVTRQEHIYEVKWGGNPRKQQTANEDSHTDLNISPRQSFSKWVEKRTGYSRPWPECVKLDLLRLRAVVVQSKLFSGVN